ncbi:Prephenate dehydratase-domain-containing protein [Xylaria cf. heliscus]|nr:Prephenate dehydratase-domain-containing protein [Xylaria cf. heliscus]
MEAVKSDEQARSGGADPKPVVCFLGPISSYTHQATMQAFPADQFDLMPVTTIKDIFDTTQSGAATFGVVPFENSTNGSVVFTLDNFADRSNVYKDLNVCQEIYLDVHHCLLGHIAPPPPESSPSSSTNHTSPSTLTSSSTLTPNPRETAGGGAKESSGQPAPTATRSRPLHPIAHVRRIYSHPQAFGQCTAFLGTWLRGIETVDVSSTSRAAELALADASGESAAVSSAVAAGLLGLDVLARNIEDREDNTTRFFVLRRGVGGEEEGREKGKEKEDAATAAAPSLPLPPSSSSSLLSTPSQAGNGGEDDADADADDDDTHLLCSTKSLLSFTVPHRSPGALADVLSCFRRGGLNLTSINSRPSLAGDTSASASAPAPAPAAASFEYIFFVEFEGHRFRDPRGRVAAVLRDVAAVARTSRWLGSWENMRKNLGEGKGGK